MTRTITLLIISILIDFSVIGQDFKPVARRYQLNKYDNSKEIGEKINGKKNGKWLLISDSNVVYLESYYINGIPVGIWKSYFPDGLLRIEKRFDSTGLLKKWTRYRYRQDNKKMIEIHSNNISVSLEIELDNFELKLYEKQNVGIGGYNLNYDGPIYYAPIELSDLTAVNEELSRNNFIGELHIYYASGREAQKSVYVNGKQSNRYEYYYKKGILKSVKVFSSNVLEKEVIYNKDGSIKKIK